MKNKQIYIISLGGSLIAPLPGIDWKFLRKFRELIIKEINPSAGSPQYYSGQAGQEKGKKFVIVTGGGSTCRTYLQAADKIVKLTKDDRDWLGIHTTRLNAHLIKTIFQKYAHPRINKNPLTKEDLTKHFTKGEGIMVAAGWRPGWSTDYVATILAKRLRAKTIINLSNIDYVYNKDPKKYKDAKKIREIGWKEFRNIVGNKWDPGLNAPFDPVASRQAQKLGLEVIIMNGKKLDNLKKYLAGKKFRGTVVK